MGQKAYIKAIEYYLPAATLSNQQIAERFPEWPAEKIAHKIGVSNRHISAADETATDMAYKVAEKLISAHPNMRAKIDFIILCSQSVDYKLPSSACILQDRLGLRTSCGAFDINLGCSGYEYELAVAKGLISAGIASNILVLTAETYTKYIHPGDKGNLTIFGDAATATIVSTEGFAEIGNFVLGTNGAGADMLEIATGGARHPQKTGVVSITDNGKRWDDYLYMDGGGIFDFTSNAVPTMVTELLGKENINQEDVDLWIFHQANKYMINYLRKMMNIDKDKFFIYMEEVGNTVSNTIPIALCEAQKQGKLRGKVLIAGFGVGLSWGATMLQCK